MLIEDDYFLNFGLIINMWIPQHSEPLTKNNKVIIPQPMTLVKLLAIIAKIVVAINVGILNASQGAAARNAAFLWSSMLILIL